MCHHILDNNNNDRKECVQDVQIFQSRSSSQTVWKQYIINGVDGKGEKVSPSTGPAFASHLLPTNLRQIGQKWSFDLGKILRGENV